MRSIKDREHGMRILRLLGETRQRFPLGKETKGRGHFVRGENRSGKTSAGILLRYPSTVRQIAMQLRMRILRNVVRDGLYRRRRS